MLAAQPKSAAGGVPARRGPATTHEVVWQEIAGPVAPFLAEVRAYLEEQAATFEPEVAEGARYALSASGKQLRPVLVALGAQSVGPLNPSHRVGAAIVELVHLATLVHDDIIDEAGVRRRRPTVAARLGNPTAVLLGDCLFAHALKLAAGFPSPEVCRIVSSATKAVCSGEILQTLRPGRLDQPLEEYFRVIRLKTAELFAVSCEIGALLGGASENVRADLRRFGLTFGTAYQVYDDYLDVFGDEEAAGKTLGTDLAKGKITLPLLLAYQRSDASGREALADLLAHPGASASAEIRRRLDQQDAARGCRDIVEQHLREARAALAALPAANGAAPLDDLTQYLAALTRRLTQV